MAEFQGSKRGHRFKDLTGKKFNRLTVVELHHMSKSSYWLCKCECGKDVVVPACDIASGHTKSCGCYKADSVRARTYLHGREPRDVFNIWHHIRARCYDKKCKCYHRYGGRGITVCQRWLDSFAAFRDDMGPRPSKAHSIERKENSGNYEPGNCVWGTATEQARNRRSTLFVEYRGEPRSLAELAEHFGLKYSTLYRRVVVDKLGLEEAIAKPVRQRLPLGSKKQLNSPD